MRTTHTLSELTGFHRGGAPTATLYDPAADFSAKGVTTASVLYNITTGYNDTVTAVSTTTLVAGTLQFSHGDRYRVTLPVPWMVQNSDMPITASECRRCGYEFPKRSLDSRGYCIVCRDEPWPQKEN
jgi:hypothetical protein